VDTEWDPRKARLNHDKHGVRFSDAVAALEDQRALTLRDPSAGEEDRWVTLGRDALGRLLVVAYCWRGERIRIISARKVERQRARAVLRGIMKKNYDFREAKRGAVLATPPGKSRITIRLDDAVLEWFRGRVEEAGGGNYQTLINEALREHIERHREPLEATLRRVIREEIRGR
jgi:uncharacterized DUF497 family protein